MAISVSRPSGRRSDDVRALKFRYRLLSFSGSYPASGGEVIQLSSAPGVTKTANVGLTRILGVIPLDTMVRAAGTAVGEPPVFDVAADGKSVAVRLIEDQAGVAGATIGREKGNGAGEAHIANAVFPVIFVGE